MAWPIGCCRHIFIFSVWLSLFEYHVSAAFSSLRYALGVSVVCPMLSSRREGCEKSDGWLFHRSAGVCCFVLCCKRMLLCCCFPLPPLPAMFTQRVGITSSSFLVLLTYSHVCGVVAAPSHVLVYLFRFYVVLLRSRVIDPARVHDMRRSFTGRACREEDITVEERCCLR